MLCKRNLIAAPRLRRGKECDNTASVHEGDGNLGDGVQGSAAGGMGAELPLDTAALPCSWVSQLEV